MPNESWDLSQALGFTLQDLPEADRALVVAALVDHLQHDVTASSGLEALDASIGGMLGGPVGGYAYQWGDVLALGDIVATLKGASGGFAPNELALIATRMLALWKRMRAVRVSLSSEEFKVLRAIKAGRKTPEDIARYAVLSRDDAMRVIALLRTRRYKEDIALVEQDDAGFSTKF